MCNTICTLVQLTVRYRVTFPKMTNMKEISPRYKEHFRHLLLHLVKQLVGTYVSNNDRLVKDKNSMYRI